MIGHRRKTRAWRISKEFDAKNGYTFISHSSFIHLLVTKLTFSNVFQNIAIWGATPSSSPFQSYHARCPPSCVKLVELWKVVICNLYTMYMSTQRIHRRNEAHGLISKSLFFCLAISVRFVRPWNLFLETHGSPKVYIEQLSSRRGGNKISSVLIGIYIPFYLENCMTVIGGCYT